jgi:hypothetical protein
MFDRWQRRGKAMKEDTTLTPVACGVTDYVSRCQTGGAITRHPDTWRPRDLVAGIHPAEVSARVEGFRE